MFEKQKMDVTDRVTAKFHDGGMKLYVDKQPIGEVSYGTSGNEYRFEEGYSQENNKFYQYTDVQKQGEKDFGARGRDADPPRRHQSALRLPPSRLDRTGRP